MSHRTLEKSLGRKWDRRIGKNFKESNRQHQHLQKLTQLQTQHYINTNTNSNTTQQKQHNVNTNINTTSTLHPPDTQ